MNLTAFIRLDDSRFTRTARGAARAVGGLTRRIGGLVTPLRAAIAGFAGAAGAVGLFWKSIGEAASAERARTTLAVLLGSAEQAKEVFDDLQAFSDVTPFEPGPVQEAGKQLLAYRFELEEVNGLLTDAGDLAATFGVNISETTRVLGRLKSGDFGEAFERLRDFGISRPQLEAEGLEFDGGGHFVGSAQEAVAAVRSIIRREYGGMMDEVSRTWDGLISTMKGKMDARFRDFGAPIMEELKSFVGEGIELFDGLDAAATRWGESVAEGIRVLRGAYEQQRLGEVLGDGLEVAALQTVDILLRGMQTAGEVLARSLQDRLAASEVGQMLGVGTSSEGKAMMGGAAGFAMRHIGRGAEALGFEQGGQAMQAMGTRLPAGRQSIAELFAGSVGLEAEVRAAKERLATTAASILSEGIKDGTDRSRLGPYMGGAGGGAEPWKMSDSIAGVPDLAAVVSRAVGEVNADRLQRIGGFVGGTGPQVDYQRRTEQNTKRSADQLEKVFQAVRDLPDRLRGGNFDLQPVWS